MKRKVCVVVPIYKAVPDALEVISLQQGVRVLGSHPFVYVAPLGLPTAAYQELCPQASFEVFDSRYFASVDGYNELMLSHEFYARFEEYEFMLIYQTDAFVFRDELLEWCNKDFDYVGGLWIDSDSEGRLLAARAGNGGFSLRKMATFLRITRPGYRVRSLSDLVRKFLHYKSNDGKPFAWYILTVLPKVLFLILPRLLGYRNSFASIRNEEAIGEDRIFVHKILANRNFRVPGLSDGHGFSWELHLEALWDRYQRLPFGCHAWSRGEYFGESVTDFWQRHIPFPSIP